MQYNHYPPSAHQVHPATHPSQSPDEYTSSYTDPSHHPNTMSYAAVTPATHLPTGPIAHQNIPPQYPYSPYATQQSSPDEHRTYYATSSQGSAMEHYTSPSSPTSSYATPNPSGHLSPQPSRHPALLSHQQQQQFIPTPSQAYQVYSSTGSTASPARSRSTVEPYYHMSPNPQHVVHAPPASTTHGTGGGNNTAHGSHHAHAHTHTGTIVVATGERYPCDLCDRSFTRLHDRRRHYETVHATSPVLHKCRFCRKDFSRADSLKRHVDNGCDEMPR
ncbi:hypothetical protein JVT61DRAFT_3296 [Boletus reticuloceps]|uniref:C2H2-type domain-containing protein n=1 Tax=Boletus reticuloceps TaxID=495285 RepID=A0A8I2YC11_9AGAM|nr:hypothetical protein JVT61DRAFT_1460 [Boletus reticuloceps]KAG6375719.1 hypothetical protein JVT61DRAFT_3296 [Boletus reticuloceps]